jgi:hypothetical protein
MPFRIVAPLKKQVFILKSAAMGSSKALTFATGAFGVLGLGTSLASFFLDGEVALAITSISCGALAAIIEVISITGPRLTWIKDINQAVSGIREKKISFEERLQVRPLLAAHKSKRDGAWVGDVGICLSIAL